MKHVDRMIFVFVLGFSFSLFGCVGLSNALSSGDSSFGNMPKDTSLPVKEPSPNQDRSLQNAVVVIAQGQPYIAVTTSENIRCPAVYFSLRTGVCANPTGEMLAISGLPKEQQINGLVFTELNVLVDSLGSAIFQNGKIYELSDDYGMRYNEVPRVDANTKARITCGVIEKSSVSPAFSSCNSFNQIKLDQTMELKVGATIIKVRGAPLFPVWDNLKDYKKGACEEEFHVFEIKIGNETVASQSKVELAAPNTGLSPATGIADTMDGVITAPSSGAAPADATPDGLAGVVTHPSIGAAPVDATADTLEGASQTYQVPLNSCPVEAIAD